MSPDEGVETARSRRGRGVPAMNRPDPVRMVDIPAYDERMFIPDLRRRTDTLIVKLKPRPALGYLSALSRSRDDGGSKPFLNRLLEDGKIRSIDRVFPGDESESAVPEAVRYLAFAASPRSFERRALGLVSL